MLYIDLYTNTFERLTGDCDLGGVAVASGFFLLFGDCCWNCDAVWLVDLGLFCLDFGR